MQTKKDIKHKVKELLREINKAKLKWGNCTYLDAENF